MRKNIYIFLFIILLSKTTMSCPSSGDGDCVPEVIDKNQTSNIQYQQNSIQNISNNYESDDGNQSDKYILTESNNIKNINKKSKLKSKIDKLNLEIDDIIYKSTNNYNSKYSELINKKLLQINQLISEDDNVDRSIYSSLNDKIDKLLETIILSYKEKSYNIFKPYNETPKSRNHTLTQIKDYNKINDIIKTLEIMGGN